MNSYDYKALVVEETPAGFRSVVTDCNTDDLPAGDVLVRVRFSALNYKDALSASGNRGVTKSYPHTPGIDAAGTVVESESPDLRPGEEVVITGYDFGMNTSGGFGEYVRVPAAWVLRLPEGLTPGESMLLGTAGLTAGMSVCKMSALVKPEDGLIAVSGATGGVGSHSLAILAAAGYRSAAITGKPEQRSYLESLGASEVILRQDLEEGGDRPMLKPRFAGGIDTLGGAVLENILKSTAPLGAVTCCGNAASGRLSMTVYPFILRGISLIGVDSQACPLALRREIWKRLASEWKPAGLSDIYEEVSLDGLPEKIEQMLAGKMHGRVLVRHRS